jgi:two-component system, chemotaxis family, protein-glutamate methylesterase/glutaminase
MEEDRVIPQRPGRVLVIGGSAGSLMVVIEILKTLTKDMDLAVLIVMHRKSADDSVLIEVLGSKCSLEVKEAEDKDDIKAGMVFVAPSDYHVLIEQEGYLTLDDSEKVNFSRPSIDVTFESAADVYGRSLVGVLLSGANADGALGLMMIKQRGGAVVIQDARSAEVPFMPQEALLRVEPDMLLSSDNVGKLRALLE